MAQTDRYFSHKFALFVNCLLGDFELRPKRNYVLKMQTLFSNFQLVQLLEQFVKMFLLLFMPCVNGTALKVGFNYKCRHQSEADGPVNAVMLLCKPCYLWPHVSVYTAVK